MATVLILTGNPLIDHLAAIDLVPGRINRCTAFQPICGGKGLNVGRVLARHGHCVRACGLAGGPPAITFRRLLAADGQEDHFTPCAADLRIGFLARDCAGAGSTGLLQNGFAVRADERQACEEQIAALLPTSDLAICSGSVCDPQLDTLYAWLCARCQEQGIPCWIDSYGPPMHEALTQAQAPALVKPNRDELADLPWDRAAERHISDGAADLIINGACGAWRIRPPAIDCVNPIGSGDSYLGALAHARLSGWSTEDCLRYACAAGALNASMMAVAELDPAALTSLAEKVQIVSNQ